MNRRGVIAVIAALAVLTIGTDAIAWGPGTHVGLASDILSNMGLLPATVAALIARHRRYFIYGSVATDTVFAKKMSRVKQVCHQWSTGFNLLNRAETDAGRAFAYGYLAHLAADTVAHNKYLPRQMAVSRSTVSFGHLYWEIRADANISTTTWSSLRRLLRLNYDEPERLLESHLQDTMLSFKTNRFLFKRMNLLASEAAWRKSVDFWSRLSRFQLDVALLDGYRQESLERIVDVLRKQSSSTVLREDPNGNWALSYAKAQRKQLRQLQRARIPHSHIIQEAAVGHAPATNRFKEHAESEAV